MDNKAVIIDNRALSS